MSESEMASSGEETLPKANGQAVDSPAEPKAVSAAELAKKVFALGLQHHQKGDLEKAIEAYNKALAIVPDFSDALNNLGVVLRAAGKREAAVIVYRRLLALRPGAESVYVNLGNVLRDLGRLEEATTEFNRALAKNAASRGALTGLGLCCRDQNWLAQSLDYFDRSLALAPEDPELNWNRALTLLRMGDYKRGWDAYEWRWKLDRHKPPRFDRPAWNGEDLTNKTVLVYGEQGFGDAIQFMRFLPEFISIHKCRVILQLRSELLPLVEGQIPGLDSLVARGVTPPPFDVHYPLLSLPRALGIAIGTIPRATYLKPKATGLTIPASGKGRLSVGIAWAGSETQANDQNRSFDLAVMAPLLENPNLKFWSLQKGKAEGQIEELGLSHVIGNLGPRLSNFADTSNVIQALDLVISADTSVMHLAGAMGKQVWVALSVFHDWRYDPVAGIAHWYPSARVFQQQNPGDWRAVFQRMAYTLSTAPLTT